MDVYTVVREAIINKDSISADYKGHHREMSPHVIGMKRGDRQALFYQYGGSSSSGLVRSQWRCIKIDELQNAQTIKGVWETGTGHSRPQVCVDVIDVEVAY